MHAKRTKMAARRVCLFVVALGLIAGATNAMAASIQANPNDFAIFTGGDLVTGEDVVIRGNIAQGAIYDNRDFYIGEGSRVEGNAYLRSNNNTSLSRQSVITGDVVATRKFNMSNRSQIGGSLHTQGDVTMGNRSSIGGNLHGDDIWMSNKASVAGNVYHDGSFGKRNNARVHGQVIQGSNPDVVAYTTRDAPNFTSGHVNLGWLRGGETHAIVAGDYTSLNIGNNATIELSAGEYNFSKLDWTGNDTEFIIDTTDGDVVLSFANEASLGDHIKFTKIGTNDFLFQAGGRTSFGESLDLDGSIYVFGSGDLTIGDDAILSGQVYTEGDFYLGEDAVIYGQGLNNGGITTTIPSPAAVFAGLFLISGTLMQRRRRHNVAH